MKKFIEAIHFNMVVDGIGESVTFPVIQHEVTDMTEADVAMVLDSVKAEAEPEVYSALGKGEKAQPIEEGKEAEPTVRYYTHICNHDEQQPCSLEEIVEGE